MKVSCVTLPDSGAVASRAFSARTARIILVLATAVLSACHRGAPRTTSPPLATPPVESITLRFGSANLAEVRNAVRHTWFNAGIQVDSENRKAGWMRAPLGGVWEGATLYKQWFLVASYYAADDSVSTVVILRGVEQANSYLATTGSRYGGPAVVASSGSARVGVVTDATQGRATAVWQKMEQVAFLLGEAGGQREALIGR